MAMLSNLDLIRRVPLFAGLTDEQAELLGGAASGGEKRRRKFQQATEFGRIAHGLLERGAPGRAGGGGRAFENRLGLRQIGADRPGGFRG